MSLAHEPQVDPSWFSQDECTCPRCERARTASSVTKTAMTRYNEWLQLAKLDTKKWQLNGMKWILFHELCQKPAYKTRGGIIADEMGLGKTILMLGAIVSNFKLHTLIVVPPALLNQWKKVIEKFGVGLINRTLIYHGRQAKISTEEDLKKSWIVLTTYGMIITRKKVDSRLTKIKWDRIVYDEAHHMRTPNTATYRSAKKLKSPIQWMVTGTPIQNKVADIQSLCSIMGLLGAISADPTSAKKILDYHLLRRTKEEVGIDLPSIKVHYMNVDWASENEKLIAAQIHSHLSFSEITAMNVDEIITFLNRTPLPMLTRARQICILPQLLRSAFTKLKQHDIIPEHLNLRDINTTSKLSAILKVLYARSTKQNPDAPSRRKLIFCHYRDEIDTLGYALTQMGITNSTICGRTKKKARKNSLEYAPDIGVMLSVCKQWNNALFKDVWGIIDSFLAPEVLILQIQTACEGLNLQHFQEIYFTSPHWNPAVEDQAVARVHRIGQERTVDVFHFIMKSCLNNTACKYTTHLSLDQYCCQVQEEKRMLASSYIK
jgi:SNF2 family DNA or RNA helicase